jgi:hypothetical protein
MINVREPRSSRLAYGGIRLQIIPREVVAELRTWIFGGNQKIAFGLKLLVLLQYRPWSESLDE